MLFRIPILLRLIHYKKLKNYIKRKWVLQVKLIIKKTNVGNSSNTTNKITENKQPTYHYIDNHFKRNVENKSNSYVSKNKNQETNVSKNTKKVDKKEELLNNNKAQNSKNSKDYDYNFMNDEMMKELQLQEDSKYAKELDQYDKPNLNVMDDEEFAKKLQEDYYKNI